MTTRRINPGLALLNNFYFWQQKRPFEWRSFTINIRNITVISIWNRYAQSKDASLDHLVSPNVSSFLRATPEMRIHGRAYNIVRGGWLLQVHIDADSVICCTWPLEQTCNKSTIMIKTIQVFFYKALSAPYTVLEGLFGLSAVSLLQTCPKVRKQNLSLTRRHDTPLWVKIKDGSKDFYKYINIYMGIYMNIYMYICIYIWAHKWIYI